MWKCCVVEALLSRPDSWALVVTLFAHNRTVAQILQNVTGLPRLMDYLGELVRILIVHGADRVLAAGGVIVGVAVRRYLEPANEREVVEMLPFKGAGRI